MAKFILPLLLLTGILAGCGSSEGNATDAPATTAGATPPEAKQAQGGQTSPTEANARSAAAKGGN